MCKNVFVPFCVEKVVLDIDASKTLSTASPRRSPRSAWPEVALAFANGVKARVSTQTWTQQASQLVHDLPPSALAYCGDVRGVGNRRQALALGGFGLGFWYSAARVPFPA